MWRSASPRTLPSGALAVRLGVADGGRPFQMWKRLRAAWWCRMAWRRLMVATLALRLQCLVVVEVTVAEAMVAVARPMRGRLARRMLSACRRESGPTMASRYRTQLSPWMVWRRLITSRYGTATCAIPQWEPLNPNTSFAIPCPPQDSKIVGGALGQDRDHVPVVILVPGAHRKLIVPPFRVGGVPKFCNFI